MDPRISQTAHATDRGSVFQVGQGDQHITYNAFYGAASAQPAPLDLPAFQNWVERIAADCRGLLDGVPRRKRGDHERRVEDLRAAVTGSPGKDVIRGLVVAGLVEYLTLTRRAPAMPLSERVVLDIVVFALWPVVQVLKLPTGWENDLVGLTSPRLTALVSEARRVIGEGRAVTCVQFTRAVAAKPLSRGVLALFDDIADPRRGGAAITALAVAARLPEPTLKKGARGAFEWFIAGIAAAASMREVDLVEVTDHLWDVVNDETTTVTLDLSGMPQFLHGGARSDRPSALAEMAHELFPGLFD